MVFPQTTSHWQFEAYPLLRPVNNDMCCNSILCKLLGHLRCGTKRRKSRPENMLINVYIDLLALKNLQSSLKLGNHFA